MVLKKIPTTFLNLIKKLIINKITKRRSNIEQINSRKILDNI